MDSPFFVKPVQRGPNGLSLLLRDFAGVTASVR